MPRYHFHIVDGVRVFDPKGLALPDEQAAQHHAKLAARNFRRNLERGDFRVRVTDEQGRIVYEAAPDEES
jgi:hypothetical protein